MHSLAIYFKAPAGRLLLLLDTMTLLQKLFGQFQRLKTSSSENSQLMQTYARLPVSFARGRGCSLWDADDREYLDALGGIAVCFLGHSHSVISETISQQASTLMHTSNLFDIPEQSQLGERFCQITGMDKVFFGNSGTEANEAAIKISRRYAQQKGIDNPIVLCAEGSFHGRSLGALSATGNAAIKSGFAPLLPGFEFVAYNDLSAFDAYAENANVVAIMIEPIQGEAGIVIPDEGYLKGLRKICDQQGWLLIVDEIQSGLARTGQWFAYQHEGILPDVMTSAKALGNGYPIGACAARGVAAELLGLGAHGTTFGGNPLASCVALAVIETIENESLAAVAKQRGELLKAALEKTLKDLPNVIEVRGKGLMLAVELSDSYDDLAKHFLAQGLVINITGGGKIIRMLPSALISEAQCEQVATTCFSVLSDLV